MKQSEMAKLGALVRMQGFLDDNSAALGTVSTAPARVLLDGVVTALKQLGSAQSAAETELTSRTKEKAVFREELRLHHMQPITAAAKKLQPTLGSMQDLALPGMRTPDIALVSAGTSMATAAAQNPQLFIDQHLPTDFIAQLQASVRDVEGAITARNSAVGVLKKATDGIKLQFTNVHVDVGLLNALVVKALKGKPDVLAAWRQAKRVKAKPGVPQGGAAYVPPVTPAAPVTPVAPVVKAA